MNNVPNPDRAVVFVERHEQRTTTEWFHVRVRYPGTKPHTLVSVPTEDEAVKAARGYSVKYGWRYDEADSQG